jgi:hypothetical protein
MRLPVFVIIAAAIAVFASGDAPARPIWAPTIDNPYCSITTYVIPDLAEQAMSTMDADEHPIIVVNGLTVRQEHNYANFLMAHECCHHTLGHVANVHRRLGQLGPQPFFYIAPQLKGMELEADCCAVRMLKQKHDVDSIQAARVAMSQFGNSPTGAHYPTGIERADNIEVCAAKNE